MAGGRSSVLTIEEILNDKTLFLQYVLGWPCTYCKAFKLKKVTDSENIDTIKENANQNARDKKLALLKAKMKKISENPDIDLVAEAEQKSGLECNDSKCYSSEYIDIEKVNEKYNTIIDKLKGNIALWNKKGYNIYGYKDTNYGLKFVKDNQEIKYCNRTEQFEKNCTIGAVELCLFSEWIKLVNDEVKRFLGDLYGLR